MKLIKETLAIFLLLMAITGLIYPLAMTGIGQLLFRHQANGSIIVESSRKVGSELIGQEFTHPGYFWSRRSTTGGIPYNGAASTGSNQGPLNPALHEAVKGRVEALKSADPSQTALVPIDLATASGSGLDPHITPAAAEYQIRRVAAARRISAEGLRQLITKQTEGRQFGLFGEPRVNVVRLNLMLDSLYPMNSGGTSNGG
jgi:K+-transporting ATPase ATPase C chain